MRGVFDSQQYQQAQVSQDTEITLGPTMVLALIFGLMLLCGVCFFTGYSMGHKGAQETSPVLPLATDGSIPTPTESGHPKPSANTQSTTIPQQNATTDDSAPEPNSAHEQLQGAAVSAASGSSSGDASSPVKPALGNSAAPSSSVYPASSAVAPAMAAGSLMVQIAAVSEQDDADVLTGALRKHGYAVTARREPLDGLIHVRIGPFKTRDEAERWRQQLLSDGYNAIVQQ